MVSYAKKKQKEAMKPSKAKKIEPPVPDEAAKKAEELSREAAEEARKTEFLSVFTAMFGKYGFAITGDRALNTKNLCSMTADALKDIHYGLTLDTAAKFDSRADIVKAIVDVLELRPWFQDSFVKPKYGSIKGDGEMTVKQKQAQEKKTAVKKSAKSAMSKPKTAAAKKGDNPPVERMRPSDGDTFPDNFVVKEDNDKTPANPIRAWIKQRVGKSAKGLSVSAVVREASKEHNIVSDKVQKHLHGMVKKGFITVSSSK